MSERVPLSENSAVLSSTDPGIFFQFAKEEEKETGIGRGKGEEKRRKNSVLGKVAIKQS